MKLPYGKAQLDASCMHCKYIFSLNDLKDNRCPNCGNPINKLTVTVKDFLALVGMS